MNCEQLKALAYGYFEKTLSEEQRIEVEVHFRGCTPCGDFVATARSMSCQQFTAFLDGYFDQELSDKQKAVFEEHIQLCPPCGDYLDSYKETVRIGHRVVCEGDSIPAGVPEKLVKAILAARKREG